MRSYDDPAHAFTIWSSSISAGYSFDKVLTVSKTPAAAVAAKPLHDTNDVSRHRNPMIPVVPSQTLWEHVPQDLVLVRNDTASLQNGIARLVDEVAGRVRRPRDYDALLRLCCCDGEGKEGEEG